MSVAAQQKPLPFHLQFVAGAVAGVSEILTMYPLDGTIDASLGRVG